MAHIPYGYEIINGKAKLDDAKSKQVKLMFEEYMSGSALQVAADKIGINRKHATIGKMIDSKVYMGDDFYPAIIDKDLWNKAQEERQYRVLALGKNKQYNSRNNSKVSPFCGKVYCTECGNEYRYYVDKNKKRWNCSNRIKYGKVYCNSPMISERVFEDTFMRLIDKIDISEITATPPKQKLEIQKTFNDPFKQAEYAYAQTPIDDFAFQTEKLLTVLQNIPVDFDGEFMKQVIKRIEIPHEGAVTFVLINDKTLREELI